MVLKLAELCIFSMKIKGSDSKALSDFFWEGNCLPSRDLGQSVLWCEMHTCTFPILL
jgi:hypothetical protein